MAKAKAISEEIVAEVPEVVVPAVAAAPKAKGQFTVSLKWQPTCVIEAATADEAKAAYLEQNGITQTDHPVTVEPLE